ncbi:MAG: hypothetical protein K2X99_01850 [Gemmatimonadaceae bacterium]|nr:hypothetical protein [Gemmatimonadaceae bacterium]
MKAALLGLSFGAPHLAAQVPRSESGTGAAIPPVHLATIPGNPSLDVPTSVHVYRDSVAVWFARGTASVELLTLKDGRVRRVGREGRGPMEFSPTSVVQGLRADSAVVQDYALRRLTIVSLQTLKGRVVTAADFDGATGVVLSRTFGDGGYIGLRPITKPGAGPTAYFVDTAEIVLAPEVGTSTTLARIGVGAGIRVRTESGYLVTDPLVDVTLPWAATQRALYFFSGNGDSLNISLGSNARRTTFEVTLPTAELLPGTAREMLAKRARGMRLSANVERALPAQIHFPRAIPLTERLYPVEGGGFWLRTRVALSTQSMQLMTKYSDTLAPLACFHLARKQRVLGVGERITIVGEEDEDGLLQLRVGTATNGCGLPLLRKPGPRQRR